MTTIPESHRDLLTGVASAHVATLMKDGSPQVTPVWIDVEGDIVVFNTAEGRLKTRNLDRDGRVALSIQDPQNRTGTCRSVARSSTGRTSVRTGISTRWRRSTLDSARTRTATRLNSGWFTGSNHRRCRLTAKAVSPVLAR